MRHKFVIAILVVSLLTPISGRALARPLTSAVAAPILQENTPTPTPTPTPDAALEEARREAALAEELKKKAVSDKERAAAEAEQLKAIAQPFGTPANVSIPTGSVTTDAAGWVESQMLAQEAARQISARLTSDLCVRPIMASAIISPPKAHPDANNANPDPINTLVIYNNNDLMGVELYNSVLGQLEKLKDELKEKNGLATTNLAQTDPRAPAALGVGPLALAAAPAIASGIIKSVAEVINLFRTDTTFTNKAVTISEDMVVSYIVNDLTSNGAATVGKANGRCPQAIKVYYPALFPPMLLASTSTSTLVVLINDVEQMKSQAVVNVESLDKRVKELTALGGKVEDLEKKTKAKAGKEGAVAKKKKEQKKFKKGSPQFKKLGSEITALDEEITEISKAIETLEGDLTPEIKTNAPNFKEWIANLTDLKAKTQSLITSTELIMTKLNAPDATTKLTVMAQLLRAEKLHSILDDNNSYTLRVAVTANGTTKVKKNLFVDAKVRHSAGANLVYQLFNKEGALAQGDVMQCYIDYQSSQNVRGVVSGALPVKCLSALPTGSKVTAAGGEADR
jgi:hypothetical protein